MTSRERMIAAMLNKQPDMVPVAPDTSNMIPSRLTGKPFWDVYLYKDPPLWQAYIHTAKHFGFDGWLPSGGAQPRMRNTAIVKRTDERIIIQPYSEANGKRTWIPLVHVYYVADPPTHNVPCGKIGLPLVPDEWEDFVDESEELTEEEGLRAAMDLMGDAGVVGMNVGIPGLHGEAGIYEYYDDYTTVKDRALAYEQTVEERTRQVCEMGPDFVFIGYSGCLTFQTPDIFRDLGLPSLQAITRVAKEYGLPSQIHSCGPEAALVEIAAKESDLTNINPLERPPMGDCRLDEIKRDFGADISLMGNLHTTEVMLHGSAEFVREESKWCLDVAAENGGFILSTGDQCGRDTPDENIHAMIEVAREHGKY